MPLGVLRLARPRRAALALPRSAAVAAGGDRTDRAGRPVPAPRLHARQVRPRLPALPPARDAVRHAAARARLGDRPRLPRDRRDAAARARVRARGLPRPAVRLVHDAARVRRAARAARCSAGSTGSTPTRSWRGSTTRTSRRPTSPTAPRPARPGLADARAGQARPVGRPRALHRAVADLRVRRPPPRGRGFQPVEAYDVLLANLDPALERTPPPEDPLEALQALPYALTTYEVAAVMAGNNAAPDPEAAEAALIDRAGDGSVIRQALGDDALWLPASRYRNGSDPGRNGARSSAGRHRTGASSASTRARNRPGTGRSGRAGTGPCP